MSFDKSIEIVDNGQRFPCSSSWIWALKDESWPTCFIYEFGPVDTHVLHSRELHLNMDGGCMIVTFYFARDALYEVRKEVVEF